MGPLLLAAALAAAEPAKSHDEWVQHFLHDPEAAAPDEPDVAAARAEAIATLKARLAAAATKATAAFTPQLPKTDAPANEPEHPPVDPAPLIEKKPPQPQKERPLVAGGRLTVGAYGFYVIGESRGGPAIELSFGANVGRFRIGGVSSFIVGSSLGITLAARVSTTSTERLAFLAAGDVGVFYGGSNGIFAPFISLHPAGLRLKAGPIGLEFHLASLSIFWLGGSTFRFVPGAGVAFLL